MSKVALLQITSSDDPVANLTMVRDMMADAKAQGAEWVLTPEVTNCLSGSRTHQNEVLKLQADCPVLAGLRDAANEMGLWVLAGSLAVKSDSPETRFANRSFLINDKGQIAAHYDKMHMFDVQVSETETYRESSGYAPGDRAVVADTPFGKVGMSICYDLRFAYLYRALAKAGADILTVPSAFSTATGPSHWEPLLRARAIETGCFVIAPAQTGTHSSGRGPTRKTYGHSMVVSPWGDVLLDAGTDTGVFVVDLDVSDVQKARSKIPALTHDRTFSGPDE